MSLAGMMAQLGLQVLPGGGFQVDGPLIAGGGIDGPIGQGDVYYLDPANGADTYRGKTPGTAFKTLAAAEDKLTANQNDVLKILADASSLSLSSLLTWDKSYTHMVGVCAPVRVAKRARIFNSGDLAKMMVISASGCIFANFYIFQGGSDGADLGCVDVTGGRNFFWNVHFAGIGHATPGAQAGAYSLYLNGAEENEFVRCTLGLDTIARGAANQQLLIDGTAPRNSFEDCLFLSAGAALTTPLMVKFVDSTAAQCFTRFKDCCFYHFSPNHAAKLAQCFSLPATNSTFDVLLSGKNELFGITEWEASDRGNIWITDAAPSAATSGIAIEPQT